MILIGVGANLPNPDFGPPRATCGAALESLEKIGISIDKRSPWYKSEPVPVSRDPWYINGIVAVTTDLKPNDLLKQLLKIEKNLGRRRSRYSQSRTIDLDIIAYHDKVVKKKAGNELQLQIPHPRMHIRGFVLRPLADIYPNWVHPSLGETATKLIDNLRDLTKITLIADANGYLGTEWRMPRLPPIRKREIDNF